MSGDDEMPEGWRSVHLNEIATDISYGHTASATDTPVGPRMLRITDIQDNQVDWTTVPFCQCEQTDKYLLKSGDIVIARTGATTGKSYLLGNVPEAAVFASYLIRVQVGASADSRFVAQFMQSPIYWQQITTVSKGTAQPGANASILGNLDIPVPPLPEQRRIVAKLESLQARSRRAREALEAVPPLLEKLRQSILAAAFRGDLTKDWREKHPDVEPASELLKRIRIERRKKWEEAELAKMKAKGKASADDKWKAKYLEPEPVDDSELPELPEGWCWARAQELARNDANAICAGPFGTIFKAKDFRDEGIPIIFLRHVAPGQYLTHKPGFMDRKIWKELFQPYSVFGGELLVTKLGDPPGACAIYPSNLGPAMVTPDVIKMEPDPHVTLGVYLMRYFNSDFARGNTFGVSYGTTRLRMTLDLFREMPVPVAPLDEQKAIVSAVEEAFAKVTEVTGVADFAKDKLANLDSAILSKAFRGELVPQEPGDAIDALGDVATESVGSVPGKTSNSKGRSTMTRTASAAKRGRRG